MLILHGTNTIASRKVLVEQKDAARKKGTEIIDLVGKELTLTKLKQSLESLSLFGQDRLVIIENLFSLPKSKTKEEVLGYLKNKFQALNSRSGTGLIIWEKKQIDGRTLKGFTKKTEVKTFKFSAMIFKFLDSLQPNNPELILGLLRQVLKKDPIELVFYMLARRTKELLIAKDLGKAGLSGMAPWQQGRLCYQAKKFSIDQLLKFHRNLLRTDWQQKTGRASLPLKSALDLLVLDL